MKAPRVRGWRTFRAYLTEGHDGDTFKVMTDGGFDSRAEPSLRLYDVYAPELAMALPPRRAPGGRETTAFVNGWLRAAADRQAGRRWNLLIASLLTSTAEPDQVRTFTRYVAQVWAFDEYERTSGDPAGTLNAAVSSFLREHPEWDHGVG